MLIRAFNAKSLFYYISGRHSCYSNQKSKTNNVILGAHRMIKIEIENENGVREVVHQEESLGSESQRPLFIQVLKFKKQIFLKLVFIPVSF